jgi:hypothetical protein
VEPVQTEAAGGCPPHHWLISNETTDQGTVERWSCQRCEAVRERALGRRRTFESSKRYIGGEVGDLAAYLGPSGERVA